MLVDGKREIELAFTGGLKLRSLVLSEPQTEENAPMVASAGSLVISVTPNVLSQIAYGNNPRAAVAVFDRPDDRTLQTLALPANPLVVVMVGIEKPGNAGAIFRSADAVGADAVILCQAGCDLFNPNLIRSSLGTVFTMAAAEACQAETIRWLAEQKLRCLAAIVGAHQSFWEADCRGPTAIVLGSEAQGLGSEWIPAPCDSHAQPLSHLTAVSIPMLGTADSLNVSVTAAALLFEARRQRRSDLR